MKFETVVVLPSSRVFTFQFIYAAVVYHHHHHTVTLKEQPNTEL